MNKKKKANNISWGLFTYKNKLYNIRDIKTWFKRIIFTLKHGYAPQAQWETFVWFSDTITEILKWHRTNRSGTPLEYSTEEYNEVLDKMLTLLAAMDENNPLYKNRSADESYAARDNAKEEFFKLFSENFWNLWD